MRVYSAGEAIGPAWEHTKALMWQDRRWGRLLKLSLVAFGAELGTSFSFNLRFGQNGGSNPVLASFLVGYAVIVLLLALIVFVVSLYLGSRLQLAQFDILVLRDPIVSPAWQRHGPQTWRWAGMKVCILLGVLLALLPLLIPAIPIFAEFMRAAQPVSQSPGHLPAIHWGAFLVVFAEVFAIVIAAFMLIRFVTSLVLPGVAMEDLRFADAFQRGWDLFRSDVPGMLWFAVLQPVFLLLVSCLLAVVMFVAALLVALPFGLLGFLLWHAMHNAGAIAWFLLGTLGVVSLLVLGPAVLSAYLVTSGTLLMFARAWSLYFIGGRYPLLGQYLEPGPAVPLWTPPPSMPRGGGDDGPGFPADPALA